MIKERMKGRRKKQALDFEESFVNSLKQFE